MASKVEVFLPEFDDLTVKQTEQIHQFVEQFLSPSALPDSYKWLRDLDGTEHEFTYANVIAPGDEKDSQKNSKKSGEKKKDKKRPKSDEADSNKMGAKEEEEKEGNDDGHAEDETAAEREEENGLFFPMCPRRVLAYKLLVARKWDMAKAFEMLRDSVAWRESNEYHVRLFFPSPIVINGYDNKTLQNFFKFQIERSRNEDLDRYVRRLRPHYWCNFHKWDKAGHPIIIEMIGQIDAKGGLKSLKDVVRPGQQLSYPVAVMHAFQNELANLLIRYQDALQAKRWAEEGRRKNNSIISPCGKGDDDPEKGTVTGGPASCAKKKEDVQNVVGEEKVRCGLNEKEDEEKDDTANGDEAENNTPPAATADPIGNIDDDNKTRKRTDPFASPVASPTPPVRANLCLHSRKNLLPSNGPIRRVTSMTAILDASGLGMSLLCSEAIEIVKTTLALDQANYPELLHRCFIVNCPAIIMLAFNIFKGSIDPRVRAKITFCGVDETPDILRKVVDAENLPAFLGGTCDCPGGCVCKTAEICAGGSTNATPCDGDGVINNNNNKSSSGDDQLDEDSSFVPTLEAKIGSREEKTEIIAVREGETVCWEWESLGKKTVEFSASFYPRDPPSYTMKMKEHIETLRMNKNKSQRVDAAPASSSSPTGQQEQIKKIEQLAVLKDPKRSSSSSSSANSSSQPSALSSSSPVCSSSPSGGPPTDDLSVSPFAEVTPAERIISHEGEFTAMGGDGKLVVSWSNAFSMFTGKSLRYRLYKKQK